MDYYNKKLDWNKSILLEVLNIGSKHRGCSFALESELIQEIRGVYDDSQWRFYQKHELSLEEVVEIFLDISFDQSLKCEIVALVGSKNVLVASLDWKDTFTGTACSLWQKKLIRDAKLRECVLQDLVLSKDKTTKMYEELFWYRFLVAVNKWKGKNVKGMLPFFPSNQEMTLLEKWAGTNILSVEEMVVLFKEKELEMDSSQILKASTICCHKVRGISVCGFFFVLLDGVWELWQSFEDRGISPAPFSEKDMSLFLAKSLIEENSRKMTFRCSCGETKKKDRFSYLGTSLFATFFIEDLDGKYIMEKENAMSALRIICKERNIENQDLERLELTERILSILHSQQEFRERAILPNLMDEVPLIF